MITLLDKKYFILSFVLFNMTNISAMFQTAEQQKINSQLKQKLQNAQGGEIIPINYEASTDIQDQVKLHNYAAYCIQLKAAKYNRHCRRKA
jgi:hypothetical protein